MADTSTLKLHAFIAQSGYCSRRQAEKLIEEGKVLVNDQLAHLGQRINPTTDQVKINGQALQPATQTFKYFLVNKPVGVVSTTSDELGRQTVLDLLPAQPERLFIVGRLDRDSQGLLLLTNDGDLAYQLTHPKFQIPKTYRVLVEGNPSLAALNHLRRGVKLKEGYTQPAQVEVEERTDHGTWLQITITEGRNQQIRRMCERVGYPVEQLIRVALGKYRLEELETARYRETDRRL